MKPSSHPGREMRSYGDPTNNLVRDHLAASIRLGRQTQRGPVARRFAQHFTRRDVRNTKLNRDRPGLCSLACARRAEEDQRLCLQPLCH